jgi:hypothetical protein
MVWFLVRCRCARVPASAGGRVVEGRAPEAGVVAARTGATHPDEALFVGVPLGGVFGSETTVETQDAVGRGTAPSATDGDAGSESAVGELSRQGAHSIGTDGNGVRDLVQ